MEARREYRDRSDTEVAVLDALVDRNDDGMTVFELRAHVDADIDDLEAALASLKRDGLVAATERSDRTVITVDERVVPDGEPDADDSLIDHILDRIGLS